MEQRLSPRFGVRVEGGFSGAHGVITNISMSGCKFESSIQRPQGSYIKFQVLLPEHTGLLHVDFAVVRWCHDTAMGIEFIRMEEAQQLVLRRFVNRLRQAHHSETAEPCMALR